MMYGILFPLGMLCAVVGLLLVGFGVPIKEFALGNTLIIAGTTTFTGGLIVVALAAAIRQLTRIAKALGQRPLVQARPMRKGEAGEGAPALPRPAPVSGRPHPPRPAPEVAASEPRGPAPPPVAPIPVVPEPRLDDSVAMRPPANLFGPPRDLNEPENVDEPDTPLLPQEPAPMPMPSIVRQPTNEPRATEVTPRSHGNAAAAARPAPRPEQEERPVPPSRPPRSNPFDVVWPVRSRNAKPSDAGGAPAGQPANRNGGVASGEQGATAEAPPVSILKSGVIDGMAYTLYTDGSIEAQLPQGMMRFASIEELRIYLETNP